MKRTILYHRAHRRLPGAVAAFVLQFLVAAVPISGIAVFFYPEITQSICNLAAYVLQPYFPDDISILSTEYIDVIGKIAYLEIPTTYPTFLTIVVNVVASVLLLVVLSRIKRLKPVVLGAMLILSIHFVAALFFVFWPQNFPYSLGEYSRLYMVQQVSIWIFVPLFMGFALLPLPSSLLQKGGMMVFTSGYAILFGTVRYIVFLYFMAKASVLYMAIIYFTLGPLIDFVYMVSVYSMHAARLANKLKGDYAVWKW